MDTKNRLTNYLLRVAKKHRILTYPVLALVALISVFSYFFNWSTGAGKRIVAVVMVIVMLVSQSYFLTSSATEVTDAESNMEAVNVTDITEEENTQIEAVADETDSMPEELDASVEDSDTQNGTDAVAEQSGEQENVDILSANQEVSVILDSVDYKGSVELISSTSDIKVTSTDGGATYDFTTAKTALEGIVSNKNSSDSNYSYTGLYTDSSCQTLLGSSLDATQISGTGQFVLYCKKELKAYSVDFVLGNTTESVDTVSYAYNGTTYNATTTVLIPASGEWNAKSASFSVSGLKRKGYNAAAPDVAPAGAVASSVSGDTVTINLSGQDTAERTVTFNWTGVPYNIQYAKGKSDDNTVTEKVTKTLTYGNADTFASAGEIGVKEYSGYDFKGWKFGQTSVNAGDTVTMALHNQLYNAENTDGVVLYPEYKETSIKIDKDSAKFQYGSAGETIIKPYYDYESSHTENSKFTIDFTNGVTDLSSIGISVKVDEEGCIHIVSTAGPTKTTVDSGAINLKFTVKDTGSGRTSDEFTVPVTVEKRVVHVSVPSEWKTKEYDGNNNVNTTFGGQTEISTDATTPDGHAIKVKFTKASYDNANAGEDKVITITGCTLDVPSGDANNYILDADAGTIQISGCVISKKSIIVKSTTKVKEIRAGEDNPDATNFGIELDPDSHFVGSDDVNALGTITYTIDPARDTDEEKAEAREACRVIPHAAENSNYIVKVYNENCATFKVTKEAPTLGGNYTVDGVLNDAGDWYVGQAPVLKPIQSSNLLGGGYDQIAISYNGATFSDWASQITLDPVLNAGGNVQIRLRNSGTGAITSVGKFTSKYDADGPQYLGYSFTSGDDISYSWDASETLNNGGLYFPGYGGVLSFGTYVKSTVKIKVKFEDTVSGLKILNYGVYSSNPTQTTTFNSDGTAVIEVLQSVVKDGVGKIVCQAVDNAGNTSDIITLRPSGNNNDDYEWSVEEKEPSQNDVSVTYGDISGGARGPVASNSGAYYRNCIANAHVVESESGIKNVKWYVNDSLIETQYPNGASEDAAPTAKTTSADFTFGNNDVFESSKTAYTVKAVVEDNAGNTKTSNAIIFLADNDAPALHVNYTEDVNKWTSDEEITFTTSDAISGVAYAVVVKQDGNITNISLSDPDANGELTGKFEITGKGKYTVRVADVAGNIHEETFNVQNISNEVPECPSFTVNPSEGTDEDGNPVEEFWYNSKTGAPTVSIGNVTSTTDQTPVETYYRHYKNDETAYDDVLINANDTEKQIAIAEDDEAIHYFEYWSVSASGVKCDDSDTHKAVVRYDGTSPEIDVQNVPEESSGSSVMLRFTVKDNVSGVNPDTIKVLRNGKEFESTIEETEDGYAGSFLVKETGNYVVTATDIAGNEASVAGFTPMSMVVNPVSNISQSKATVSANVYRGTADVSVAPIISIRKETDEEYTESENTIATQDENGNWALSAVFDDLDEDTVYVFKVHAVSDIDEVLEYEGYLRTSSSINDGAVVRGTVSYPVGSTLPDWNTSGRVTVGLYDGNICVAATTADAGGPFAFTNVPDGTYNIVATDGVYKKSLGITIDNHVVVKPSQAISLVLSGQNTSVVISTPDTPKITVDNMDSIFIYDNVVNFTDEDRALIEANGTVEFRLYASLSTVVDVSKDELAIIQRVGSDGKIVAKYLNLTLEKITTDAAGNVEKTQVSELSNGASITITIPLQDLAGKPGVEVVRVHDGSAGLEGYRYEVDMDSNPNTFTLTSNKFSTYAILYTPDKDDDKTTETTTDSTVTTETTTETTTENNNSERPITPADNHAQAGGQTTSFGSVGSGSGAAKTGDATPIALIFMLMVASVGGTIIIRRKIQ